MAEDNSKDNPPEREVPPPVTREEAYFAAILDELKGLRADQARAPAVPEPGPIREPRLIDEIPIEPATPTKSLLQRITGR